ncbi:von Willebrand factor type A domain protein [Rhodobacteraceae bacterium KLH11]|nr:von Willebrand factor type A domain protein [Rhodobacteraceae bacterium KLH11]
MMLLRSIVVGLCLTSQAHACDLALALAVDVSGSVDSKEYRIQMDGLAAGLRDPIVSEALVRGQAHLMLVQWTGSSRQQVTIPWTRIDSFATVEHFASQVASDPRIWRNYSTAIGEALEMTVASFDDVSNCKRHLIDLSGDGVSNEGIEPAALHRTLREKGITVNAIAIEESEPDLTAYFFENVIVGEGAFVVSAAGFADYPDRIRKKLLREVTQQTAGLTQDLP